MKLTNSDDVRRFAALIGAPNTAACNRVLADGGEVWIFLTHEELDADPDLSIEEKRQCRPRFTETDGAFAGWFRPPAPIHIPGFTVRPNFDVHGNYRGGTGSYGEVSAH